MSTRSCPSGCGETLEWDEVDIGVGMMKCGPAYCSECEWVEPPYNCRDSSHKSQAECDCPPTLREKGDSK